ncbi:MAG: CoB--CoM heterodisulfide reductase iron-sulfur subunit A family protein, partial [Chloroflexi bacterium]|nr:CoB--CoM heterodisulfide reductase iron-sulfur subunit A family protein [Chloroflexota bacterium]
MALTTKVGAVAVVGAGIGGMSAAVDLADAGHQVYLVDSQPSIGGVVAQLGFMFPTHDCVLCRATGEHHAGCTRPAISPRLLDHDLHPNIHLRTQAQVVAASDAPGDFRLQLRLQPRYVDPSRCINCDICAQVCPVELPDDFQAGLGVRKAAYKVAPRAVPNAYVVQRGGYCDNCLRCQEKCPTRAIDLGQAPHDETLHVGAVVLTTGYRLYDPTAAEEFGYGRYPNVLTSLEFERLVSRAGPTEGLPERRSDGQAPQNVAWLQCIGSRDEAHPYCSSICCMYTTKQAILARQRLPHAAAKVFIMDERAFNKETYAYYQASQQTYGVEYVRCRVSEVKEDPLTHDLCLGYLDDAGRLRYERFGMVVLAVGSEPPQGAAALAGQLGIDLNPYGFCDTSLFTPLRTSRPGVFVAGAFSAPKEIAETVLDASGAAAESLRLLADTPSAPPRPLPPERDVQGEAPRVGVFICRCGAEVAGVVDTAAVTAMAGRLPHVAHAQEVEFACLAEGQALIAQALRDHRLNRAVVAACSPRTHEALFRTVLQGEGLNPYLLEFTNLREQCAWVHADDPAGATRQAKETVRVSAARAASLGPVAATRRPVQRQALVLGGGVAGMTAALTLADWGSPVTLVEKTGALGGHARRLYFTPQGPSPQELVSSLTYRLTHHPRITVLLNSELAALAGHAGDFRATLQSRSADGQISTQEVRHGALIVATGAIQGSGAAYGHGQDARVVTQTELESKLALLPQELAQVRQVVMIQCVRPPEAKGLFCSRTCCTAAMKNAIRLKRARPDVQIAVLYKEIMTYGFREQYYTEARRLGVLFVRYDDAHPPRLSHDDGRLVVTAHDPVMDAELRWEADLLALSVPPAPNPDNARLAGLLGVPISGEGFFLEDHIKLRPADFNAA